MESLEVAPGRAVRGGIQSKSRASNTRHRNLLRPAELRLRPRRRLMRRALQIAVSAVQNARSRPDRIARYGGPPEPKSMGVEPSNRCISHGPLCTVHDPHGMSV